MTISMVVIVEIDIMMNQFVMTTVEIDIMMNQF